MHDLLAAFSSVRQYNGQWLLMRQCINQFFILHIDRGENEQPGLEF